MLEKRELWRTSAAEGYIYRRIPGMIVTKKGTVIIYYEERRDRSDWALMRIRAQRSTDGGISFGEPFDLAVGTEDRPTVNNPVMVEDKNGCIHFLYCEDYSVEGGRVLHRVSEDDGESFVEATDITDVTMPDTRNAFALGPGHGICKRDGTLLFPVWMVPKSFGAPVREHMPSVLSVLYSRDDGASWQMGDILPTTDEVFQPNETECAELEDGRVYFSIRHMARYRASAMSESGYSDFYRYRAEKSLTDPVCFGSVLTCKRDGSELLLIASCEHETERRCVAVKASTDGGESFPLHLLLNEAVGGYVECAYDETRDLVYVFYEESAGEALHFARFSANELK